MLRSRSRDLEPYTTGQLHITSDRKPSMQPMTPSSSIGSSQLPSVSVIGACSSAARDACGDRWPGATIGCAAR